MDNPNWYALYTRPAQEAWAAVNLRNQSIETLAPQRLVRMKNGGGKFVNIPKPLFPRYIFACFNLDSHCRSVRSTRGVHSIVSFDEGPAIVPAFVIDEIQSRLDSNGILQGDQSLYKHGERVRVTRMGALNGVEAAFDSYLSDQERVLLLMTWMGRDKLMPFDVAEIEPLSYASA